ncbi:MAG TPA: hypothetical protein VLE53_07480 [Gemmatimonadaceae bacterium]|nr:hypothetical protein [Gemmatimonadaceae bacterium]
MIYESHLAAAEAGAWTLDGSIAWDGIDLSMAGTERELHTTLHDAALIEGYLPVLAARLLPLLWDDVDATAVLSLELYEGLKHYTALKRYLDRVGFEAAGDAEAGLVVARQRALSRVYAAGDVPEHLTHFTCSELFAAYFFLRIARRTREPVLRDLLGYMSRDEFRHAAAAGDVLRQRLARAPSETERVLEAARHFRHYGSDVVEVPVAEANDFEAIMAMNRKIRWICGLAVTEHLEHEEGAAHADQ